MIIGEGGDGGKKIGERTCLVTIEAAASGKVRATMKMKVMGLLKDRMIGGGPRKERTKDWIGLQKV